MVIMRKNRKTYKQSFPKKLNASLLLSKNETVIGVSIMFFEIPTSHTSKIMPICLLNTLLKSN